MTRYKCGIYTKKEDYNKFIIVCIVYCSIFFIIAGSITLIWLNYIETSTIALSNVLIIVNSTNANFTLSDKQSEEITELFKPIFLGIPIIIITPIMLGGIFAYWVSNFICDKLGVSEWNITTCRCCGKKVREHEPIDKSTESIT